VTPLVRQLLDELHDTGLPDRLLVVRALGPRHTLFEWVLWHRGPGPAFQFVGPPSRTIPRWDPDQGAGGIWVFDLWEEEYRGPKNPHPEFSLLDLLSWVDGDF